MLYDHAVEPVPVDMQTPELFCFSAGLLSAFISYKEGLRKKTWQKLAHQHHAYSDGRAAKCARSESWRQENKVQLSQNENAGA